MGVSFPLLSQGAWSRHIAGATAAVSVASRQALAAVGVNHCTLQRGSPEIVAAEGNTYGYHDDSHSYPIVYTKSAQDAA